MGLPEKVWVESCSKSGSVWSSVAPTACLTRRRRSSNGGLTAQAIESLPRTSSDRGRQGAVAVPPTGGLPTPTV